MPRLPASLLNLRKFWFGQANRQYLRLLACWHSLVVSGSESLPELKAEGGGGGLIIIACVSVADGGLGLLQLGLA